MHGAREGTSKETGQEGGPGGCSCGSVGQHRQSPRRAATELVILPVVLGRRDCPPAAQIPSPMNGDEDQTEMVPMEVKNISILPYKTFMVEVIVSSSKRVPTQPPILLPLRKGCLARLVCWPPARMLGWLKRWAHRRPIHPSVWVQWHNIWHGEVLGGGSFARPKQMSAEIPIDTKVGEGTTRGSSGTRK